MLKAVFFFAAGFALAYALLVYPVQSKKLVQTSVHAASSALADGAKLADEQAEKQLSKEGKKGDKN